jgi:hypothetical protein
MATNQFTRIKIFGERNTGTNFLSEVIEGNFKATLFKPVNIKSVRTAGFHNFRHADAALLRNRDCRGFMVMSGLLKSIVANKITDYIRVDNASVDFGWKHGCVNMNQLKDYKYFDETLFVMLIRNPWKFCESLFRKPYNIMPGRLASPNFSDFIRAPIFLNARDNAPRGQLMIPNAIELWNIKVSSYYNALKASQHQVAIFYYEEILLNPSMLQEQLQSFGIESVSDNIIFPELDVKKQNTNRTLSDFVSLAKTYDPLSSMTADDAKFIHSALSKKLIMRTPYLDLYNSLASSVEA